LKFIFAKFRGTMQMDDPAFDLII